MLPPIRVEDGRVSHPTIFSHCLLRRILVRWAARFTSDEALQIHLVEKTISEILREFPVADDDSSIDVELLATMRRVLLREFGVAGVDTSGPAQTNAPLRTNDQ